MAITHEGSPLHQTPPIKPKSSWGRTLAFSLGLVAAGAGAATYGPRLLSGNRTGGGENAATSNVTPAETAPRTESAVPQEYIPLVPYITQSLGGLQSDYIFVAGGSVEEGATIAYQPRGGGRGELLYNGYVADGSGQSVMLEVYGRPRDVAKNDVQRPAQEIRPTPVEGLPPAAWAFVQSEAEQGSLLPGVQYVWKNLGASNGVRVFIYEPVDGAAAFSGNRAAELRTNRIPGVEIRMLIPVEEARRRGLIVQ